MVSTSFGGSWTQDKLHILERYLDTYTTVLKNQPFSLTYFDAFAGEGQWSPTSSYTDDDYSDFRELHLGSPRIALEIQDKPFDKLVFVEKDGARSRSLQNLMIEYPERDIEIINDDANDVVPRFCDNMAQFDRAVVFLDPFATEVSWDTVTRIAGTQKIDCWILFPLGAIARMMPRNEEPSAALRGRLDWIFGGRKHWQALYSPSEQRRLIGEPAQERSGSGAIAELYRERLKSVFVAVAPTRRTLRNTKNSPMFELFFGASNPTGAAKAIPIADHLLKYW